jgi:small-conductance mechanosensitive channel
VVVDTWDGRRLFIPSKAVLDSVIINHTIRGQRRTTLDVGVAYDSDLAEAQRVLLEATSSVEGVFSNPPPEALVTKFGDSSINFAARFFHKPVIIADFELRDQVARAVRSALDAAGIEIAFPQRVVWQGRPSGSDDPLDSQ